MHRSAFLLVCLGACIAGASGLFVKYMDGSMSASTISWFRMGVPTIVLGLWLSISGKKLFTGNYKKMLFASLLNAFRMYLYFVAFIYTSIGNAVILLYTWPIFVALIGHFYLKEKFNKIQWALLIMAFIGLIVSYSDKQFSFQDGDMIGMMAAIGSAFVYAFTVIIYKTESNNYSRNELIFYQNLVGGLVFLPFLFSEWQGIEIEHLCVGIFYACMIGILVFNLFFFGLKYLKASTASTIMYLEVVSAIILSYLILGDLISFRMFIGGILIILGSFLINKFDRST